MIEPETLAIQVDDRRSVSGFFHIPDRASACYVFAHGAGAGMTHPFMAAVAAGFSDRRIATLRYQFPYMETGGRRPDNPAIAQATVRAAVGAAASRLPSLPLFAGGKSFGGRMTSQAQAHAPLPQVQGLIFFGFPLHPPKQPSDKRATHLSDVHVPTLFLQGDRDALAEKGLLSSVVLRIGDAATLVWVDGANHSFHVPVRSGKTDAQVLADVIEVAVSWIERMRR